MHMLSRTIFEYLKNVSVDSMKHGMKVLPLKGHLIALLLHL